MAILIEEERKDKGTKALAIFIWLIIIAVIVAAIYYLFLKTPDIAAFTTPTGFRNTEAISQINLSPEHVVRSSAFQALKQYIPPLATTTVGRQTSLLGF